MNHIRRIPVIVLVSLAVLGFFVAPVPSQARITFETYSEGLWIKPVIYTEQLLFAYIDATRSGYSVYVRSYSFEVWHRQHLLPLVLQDLQTLRVKIWGTGIQTVTVSIVSNGVFRSSDIPSWMTVTFPIPSEPKDIDVKVVLPVNRAFSEAWAYMEVYTVGTTTQLIPVPIPWIPFAIPVPIPFPFSITYTVKTGAYLDVY
jgi:hypothetical protein